MPTTLTNGIQLPDKGSVDWYSSMQSNYNLIDTHLGNTDIHVTAEDKANWDSKQGSLSQTQLDAIAQVATNTSDIATLQSGKANASHTHSSSDITDIGDYATKTYVDNSISGLVDNAPDALNTLNELSAALNDDSNFASTVTTALADKANSADLATVATSGSYNDLSNKPTINDSTITIQKNGSTVDTFTTNGSAKTINIPVPTKTSDLTNDSNFVVSSSLATVATSGDYDDLSNKPSIPTNTSDLNNDSGFITLNDFDIPSKTSDLTNDSGFITSSDVPTGTSDLINDSNFVDTSNSAVSSGITSAKVTDYDTHIADTDIHVTTADKTKWNNGVSQSYVFRYSSTALVASSTNSNTLLDNTDNLKVGDKVIDSNGVLFSITAIDSVNSTFTVGTALIDLAQDSDVVHKTGDETSTGFKEFANIRATNSIKAINLENTTTDLNNCYSDFASSDGSRAGNIQYYYCNADSGVINISNLPEARAFFLTSITTRLVKNYLYVKQILINSNSKTFVRYCHNGTWSSWVNETDSEYVHKSGNETVIGSKRFGVVQNFTGYPSIRLYSTDDDITVLPSSVQQQDIRFTDKNDALIARFIFQHRSDANEPFRTCWRQNRLDGTNNYYSVNFNNLGEFYPENNNTIVLGRSSNKWKDVQTKLINGLTPSSLSLPDLSNGIDISSYLTNAGTTTPSEYTPLTNGWMCIGISADSPPALRVFTDSGFDAYSYTERSEIGGSGGIYTRYGSISVPVVGGVTYKIIAMPSTMSVITAKFFPCLGNV